MRRSPLSPTILILISAVTVAIGGVACSQVTTPPPAASAAPSSAPPILPATAGVAPETRDTTEKSQDAVSEEDQKAAPFPVGRHAATVKRVCTECHNAKPILDIRFSKDEATRYYRLMVSSDTTTEDARKVIEYLSTTLGE